MGVICSEVVNLSDEDKKTLMIMVKRHDAHLLKRFPDGTRIVLNKLPPKVVENMYNFVKRRLNLN